MIHFWVQYVLFFNHQQVSKKALHEWNLSSNESYSLQVEDTKILFVPFELSVVSTTYLDEKVSFIFQKYVLLIYFKADFSSL